jgi:hypothetical protein
MVAEELRYMRLGIILTIFWLIWESAHRTHCLIESTGVEIMSQIIVGGLLLQTAQEIGSKLGG